MGTVSDEDFAAIKAAGYSDASWSRSAWLSRPPSSPTSSPHQQHEIDFPAVA